MVRKLTFVQQTHHDAIKSFADRAMADGAKCVVDKENRIITFSGYKDIEISGPAAEEMLEEVERFSATFGVTEEEYLHFLSKEW